MKATPPFFIIFPYFTGILYWPYYWNTTIRTVLLSSSFLALNWIQFFRSAYHSKMGFFILHQYTTTEQNEFHDFFYHLYVSSAATKDSAEVYHVLWFTVKFLFKDDLLHLILVHFISLHFPWWQIMKIAFQSRKSRCKELPKQPYEKQRFSIKVLFLFFLTIIREFYSKSIK